MLFSPTDLFLLNAVCCQSCLEQKYAHLEISLFVETRLRSSLVLICGDSELIAWLPAKLTREGIMLYVLQLQHGKMLVYQNGGPYYAVQSSSRQPQVSANFSGFLYFFQ